jgi:hypothetical protein
VSRFLSEEWVAGFNAALAGADLSGTQGTGSLAASGGTFSVGQEVTGAPGGTVRTVLRVSEGRAVLERGDDLAPADVTVSLGYDDAAALSRGELDPGGALATGRVRVRGDLSVLMAGQSLLAAAAGHLGALSADTTY